MIRIELRFLAGRYHATAWGTHVNEGVVEWPPSPWRICRALLAVWHRKLHSELTEELMNSLIERLAEGLPSYSLPIFEAAHTRHYMPVVEGKAEKRAKVFDTFHQLVAGRNDDSKEPSRIIVHWPTKLNDPEQAALTHLLKNLTYFGRAESLVEARLMQESEPVPKPNAMATEEGIRLELGEDEEVVEVLAPVPWDAFLEWVESRPKPAKKGKKPAKGRPAENLRKALEVDTDDWRDAGWSRPPGSRWVTYQRAKAGTEPVHSHRTTHRQRNRPTAVRYAIASNVLPRIKNTLKLTEPVHDYLLKVAENRRTEDPELFDQRSMEILRGTDDHHQPLKGHEHAYLLPECDDQARIRFLTIYSRYGFDNALQDVLEKLTRLEDRHQRKAFGELQFVLIGIGQPENFGGLNHRAGESLPLARSQVWRSLTPFVPTRHPKRRKGVMNPREEAGRDLERLLELAAPGGSPLPVEAIEAENALPSWIGPRWQWRHFRTRRERGDGSGAGNVGFGFRIRFSEPVQGPLAFGYGAHYGLGLFVPEDDRLTH